MINQKSNQREGEQSNTCTPPPALHRTLRHSIAPPTHHRAHPQSSVLGLAQVDPPSLSPGVVAAAVAVAVAIVAAATAEVAAAVVVA
jgi:hypothetical protein